MKIKSTLRNKRQQFAGLAFSAFHFIASNSKLQGSRVGLKPMLVPISLFDRLEWEIRPLSFKFRTDISRLLSENIRVPSDLQTSLRGAAHVGKHWTSEHNHQIPLPGQRADPDSYLYNTYETIRLLFEERISYSETPEFHEFLRRLQLGETPYGVKNLEDLNKRGQKLIALYHSLREQEFRAYKQDPEWDVPHFYIFSSRQITLGRHGNHRLAIARHIGLERFPARFGGIHLEFIEEMFGAGVTQDELFSSVLSVLTNFARPVSG